MDNIKLIPFNFKKINGKYLLVNIAGDHIFLNERDFNDFINQSNIDPILENRFYYKDAGSLNNLIKRYRNNKRHLNSSTSLFIFVLTNRCNLNCIYCQADKINTSDKKYDMNRLTAKKTIDLILQFPSKYITIEFQGGEPLLNFELIQFIVKYIKGKSTDKQINFTMVSNLIAMDNEKIKFILENNISLSVSCDGAKDVQDYNRPLIGSSCSLVFEDKIKLIKEMAGGDKYYLNGILTCTRKSLQYPREAIDEYLKLGLNSIYVRPLNPFGLARKTFSTIGYTPQEYLEFYKDCLNYIIEINKDGNVFIEGTAQVFLKKILGDQCVNHMEYRSPCGAAIGQIAINYDGNIYTCDEGRMVARSGNNSFQIGNVNLPYQTLFDNNVVRTMCAASCAEGFPRCNQCTFMPYCGVCPIINYMEEGDIFKNNSFRCSVNEGIIDYLFQLIDTDIVYREIFLSWVS